MTHAYRFLYIVILLAITSAGCQKAEPEKEIIGKWTLFKSEARYKYSTSSEIYERTIKCDGVNMKHTLECTNCSANGGVSQFLTPYKMTLEFTKDNKFVLKEESGSGYSAVMGYWTWTSSKTGVKLTATSGLTQNPANVQFFLDSSTLSITLLNAKQMNANLYSVEAVSNKSYGESGTFIFRKDTTATTATTTSAITYGTMTDSRDGKTYKTVKIGSQTWMAENLKYAASCAYAYNGDLAKVDTYGYLYSEQILSIAPPAGWHIPTEAEVKKLADSLGTDMVAARELKSTEKWLQSNDATNSTGFSFLPAGNGVLTSFGTLDHYDNMYYVAYCTYITNMGTRGQMCCSASPMLIFAEAYNLSLLSVRYIKD
jgi:uncharacterized protein (TIGR02145 family)